MVDGGRRTVFATHAHKNKRAWVTHICVLYADALRSIFFVFGWFLWSDTVSYSIVLRHIATSAMMMMTMMMGLFHTHTYRIPRWHLAFGMLHESIGVYVIIISIQREGATRFRLSKTRISASSFSHMLSACPNTKCVEQCRHRRHYYSYQRRHWLWARAPCVRL